jgi:hypothetical protein
VVGGLIGGAIGSSAGGKTSGAAPVTASSPSSSPSPSPIETTPFSPPAPLPSPDAQYQPSCSYLLGDFSSFTSHGFRFIAGADITNDGNVGVVVKIVASWKQLGSAPITMTKVARIPYGGSQSVEFTKEVGSDNIDKIQAVQGDDCSVKVSVTDVFGEPQG